MEFNLDHPNYSEYSLHEHNDVLSNIGKEAHLERVQHILKEIALRHDGSDVTQNDIGQLSQSQNDIIAKAVE